ncbi:DEAD/DEAH box helicase [Candidatus Woesearchaeota archaeon]|nr:DEAD/DEAH box helicase [Candidatus Woesearchaeota archaeon]
MKFEDLQLKPELLKAVHGLGFSEPTDIQERCIPLIKQGKDIVAQSKTGSGKTAAFGLPILENIGPGKGLQVLVLTPTRELCVQVSEALHDFGRFLHMKVVSVYGGVGISPQIDAIRRADIVVGTPGRILDHLQRRTIEFSLVRFLVLDEADKMFEMGFVDDVEQIIRQVPTNRQTLLFSATIPAAVHTIVRKHQHHPVNVKSELYVEKGLLKQVYYNVSPHDKFSLFVHFLRNNVEGIAMVFVATRREADIVARNLKMQSIKAMAIHGGMSQNQRLHALNALKSGDINTLVATDVAARGLDIRNVSHVYNYDVPKTSEEYVHRIGRTARAGDQGDAITLLTERDYDNFNNVLRDHTLEIKQADLPRFERVRFVRQESGRHGMRRPGGHRDGNREGFSRGGGQASRREDGGFRRGERKHEQRENRWRSRETSSSKRQARW